MPARLNENGLTRIIKVYGVEQPVALTLLPEGISFKIAGRGSKAVTAPWADVVKACRTADNVKCYSAGDPLGYLITEARRKTTKAAKKATKEAND